MIEFAPVWVSTAEQLSHLEMTYREASLPAKLLGRYTMPDGTAHLRGVLMPWMRVPIVFLAQGRLTVAGDRMTFASTPLRAPGWFVHGVDPGMHWQLSRAELETVEPMSFSSPFAKFFDIPFTRIRSSRPGLLGDFLVCVGGRFSMPKVRARSLDLRLALQRFIVPTHHPA